MCCPSRDGLAADLMRIRASDEAGETIMLPIPYRSGLVFVG